MWVITVFEQDTFRLFEFNTKEEALTALSTIGKPAILTYTMLHLAA